MIRARYHNQLWYFLLGTLLSTSYSLPSWLPGFGKKQEGEKKTEVVSSLDKQLAVIAASLESLNKQDSVKDEFEKISNALSQLKHAIERASEDRKKFLQKKQAISSQVYQTLGEIQQEKTQYIALLTEHQSLIEQLKSDPEMKMLSQQIKASPAFEDLQRVGKQVADLRDSIADLESSKKNLLVDQSKRKKAFEEIKKEYDETRIKRDSFASDATILEDTQGLTREQQGELLDAQFHLLKLKKQLTHLKNEETAGKLSLIETKLHVLQKKLAVLERDYTRIKQSVIIEPTQVKEAEAQLEKARQDFAAQRDRIDEDIRLLLPSLEEARSNFVKAGEDAGTSAGDITSIQGWSFDSDKLKTIPEWKKLSKVGLAYAQKEVIDSRIKNLEARLNEAKFDFAQKELRFNILHSWQKMTRKTLRLNVAEMLEQEIKRYESDKNQLKIDVIDLTEKRDKAIDQLYHLNIARESLKSLISTLLKSKETIFGGKAELHHEILTNLLSADDALRAQIENATRLMESYAKSLAAVQDMLKKLTETCAELSAKSWWVRSESSIDWKEVKHVLPDILRFAHDIRITGKAYLSRFSIGTLGSRIEHAFKEPYFFLRFLLQLIALLLTFLLLRSYLPDARAFLLRGESRYHFWFKVRYFVGIVIDFAQRHLLGIYLWSILLLGVLYGYVQPYFAILFYLFSIPYLLYLAYHFFAYFAHLNSERNFIFISKNSSRWFMFIVSTFAYASIVILFFRLAFLKGNYFSQVPDILFALNFILLQLAFLGLLTKDSLLGKTHVIGIVPRSSPFGKWLEEHIERYFFLVWLTLAIIIIVINPYVGYGRQVLYLLSRFFITILLIPLFSWLYEKIKRISSDFFFYYPDGLIVKERFSGGKTWYGFFVIASFLFFIVIGIFLISWVWDRGIGWIDIKKWLSYELTPAGIDEITGQKIQVTVSSILKILMYIAGGIGVVYVLNRFVLKRIFDPLLVGTGVQSTIMTLSNYVIVVMAFLMGLSSVGLNAMATKLVFMVAAVAYVIKEPVGDFLSYFIILVQRPIKIGDYIKMEDPAISGVVRHITPRTTVIRCNNSTSYIVPNSLIVTKTIQNWHYSRSFSSIDDLRVTVPFSADTEQVRILLLQVLEEHSAVLRNPAPVVRLDNFVDNGYSFLLRGYISADRVMDKWDIESQLRLNIVKKLNELNIEIASPIQLIRLEREQ